MELVMSNEAGHGDANFLFLVFIKEEWILSYYNFAYVCY
jgi:hypothetical protein